MLVGNPNVRVMIVTYGTRFLEKWISTFLEMISYLPFSNCRVRQSTLGSPNALEILTCRPDPLVLARGTKAIVHDSALIAAECRIFWRLSDDVRRRGERDADIRLLIDRHASFHHLRLHC